jgi:hypothetical protein
VAQQTTPCETWTARMARNTPGRMRSIHAEAFGSGCSSLGPSLGYSGWLSEPRLRCEKAKKGVDLPMPPPLITPPYCRDGGVRAITVASGYNRRVTACQDRSRAGCPRSWSHGGIGRSCVRSVLTDRRSRSSSFRHRCLHRWGAGDRNSRERSQSGAVDGHRPARSQPVAASFRREFLIGHVRATASLSATWQTQVVVRLAR